jgi:hypothetical protein
MSFDRLEAQVPCCDAVISLNGLRFEQPMGFARFEVSVMNGTRAKYELDNQELARVASVLGHPVKQILAHY